MIDTDLMQTIREEVLQAAENQAMACLKSGIRVMPNPNMREGDAILLIHPSVHARLIEKAKTENENRSGGEDESVN